MSRFVIAILLGLLGYALPSLLDTLVHNGNEHAVWLRATPEMSENRIGEFPAGASAPLLAEFRGWNRIAWQGNKAWVHDNVVADDWAGMQEIGLPDFLVEVVRFLLGGFALLFVLRKPTLLARVQSWRELNARNRAFNRQVDDQRKARAARDKQRSRPNRSKGSSRSGCKHGKGRKIREDRETLTPSNPLPTHFGEAKSENTRHEPPRPGPTASSPDATTSARPDPRRAPDGTVTTTEAPAAPPLPAPYHNGAISPSTKPAHRHNTAIGVPEPPRNGAKEASTPYLAKVEPSPTTQNQSSEVTGREFEEFVARKFGRRPFAILDWTGDKGIDAGIYVESTKGPDLLLELTLRDESFRFAIECKYRSKCYPRWFLPWASSRKQVARYLDYQETEGIPVFVAIGLGGTARNPAEFFVASIDFLAEHLRVVDGTKGAGIAVRKLESYAFHPDGTPFYEPATTTLTFGRRTR